MPTILLADDDPMQHELVQATLGRAHRVLQAWNGREALAVARRERPDLVLLDVLMPELDGFEVCRQLKADPTTREIEVVMLSARGDRPDRRRGVEAGADVYMTKPFSPSALLDTVRQALGGDVAQALATPVLAEPVPPSERPAELVQTLAYAHELSALYEAAQERAARFRFLVELGKDLVAARGLDALLRLALERATTFSGHDAGSVLLLAGPDGPLKVRASVGKSSRGSWLAALDDLAARALRELRPVTFDGEPRDASEPQGTPPADSARPSARPRTSAPAVPAAPGAAVGLPLVTPGGVPLGVLRLESRESTGRLQVHDLDALQLLASQLAAAIESVQLHERLQHGLEVLQAIHEAGRVLSATLEADAIGGRLLDIARRVSGLEAAVVRLRNRRQHVRLWQTAGPEALWRWAQATAASRAARKAALATGEAQCFALGVPPDGAAPLTGWCICLRVQDRVLGVLEAYGREDRAAENTAEFLGSLASQAATALDNARLYRELAERERQLAELVGRLLVAQEEERRRIAYNLHDDLAQLAAGIHQRLQAFAHDYRPASPQAQHQLDQTVELARRMVGQTRGVIADLRPTTLDDFGLAIALRAPVEALRADGWEVAYEEALGAERLPPAVETALFRVAQEALGNVRKHAGTTRVQVALRRRDRAIRLEVVDWGRGFRVSAARAGAGAGERVGLLGMRERIALLGGHCVVRSRPGAGTRVIAEVPLPGSHE